MLRAGLSDIGVMGEIIPPVNAGVINKGAESAELHSGLGVKEGDILLDKPRFGSFHGTDLEVILRSKSIDSIIIMGKT